MSLRRISSLCWRYCRSYSSSTTSKQWTTNREVPTAALRPKKAKSTRLEKSGYFADIRVVRTIGGKGGDGCASFLRLWANENAGPDGGDGGNGGHVLFKASRNVSNLSHVFGSIQGDEGEKGASKNCHGKSANHTIVKVPIGTVIRNQNESIVGDLSEEGMIFVAARGGAGGKGNTFFTTDTENAPKICERGPSGEEITYVLEMRTIADIGIIGFPNAGKSTLLNAISRAHPKVAPYAFTTLRPNLGMVQYADSLQLAVADLPGIIPDAHLNKGLGIQFLKHVEHCSALMFLLDASAHQPWVQYESLLYEMSKFNSKLMKYPRIVVANKIDKSEASENLLELKKRIDSPVIGISAKIGTNLKELLQLMRLTHMKQQQQEKKSK